VYPKHYDYYSITITLSLLPYNYYAQRASETISYCFGWCHTLGIANNSQATAQHFLSIPAQDPAAFCLKHSVLTSKHSVYLHWLVHTRVHTHRHSLYFFLSLSLHTHSLYTHMLYGEGVEGADTQDDGEEARTGGGEGRDAGEQRGH